VLDRLIFEDELCNICKRYPWEEIYMNEQSHDSKCSSDKKNLCVFLTSFLVRVANTRVDCDKYNDGGLNDLYILYHLPLVISDDVYYRSKMTFYLLFLCIITMGRIKKWWIKMMGCAFVFTRVGTYVLFLLTTLTKLIFFSSSSYDRLCRTVIDVTDVEWRNYRVPPNLV
jgi:hypothetical protein